MQQFFITLALLFSASLLGQATESDLGAVTADITVTVVNVPSDEGEVKFALYQKENFMSEPVQSKAAESLNGRSTVVFNQVPPGAYAVLCFHDRNGNDRMDFDIDGFPLENYGASNNVFRDGPPIFEDARFEVGQESLSLEIKF